MGNLTGRLQARQLDLDSAARMLSDTRRDLESLDDLLPEVAVLRDYLIGYLSSGIPASEMAWFGLLHLKVKISRQSCQEEVPTTPGKIDVYLTGSAHLII